MKKQEIIIGLVAIVLVFFIFKGIRDAFKNLFGTFGIGSTTTDDARESEIEKVEKKANEFSPLYWKKAPQGKTSQLLTMASTNAIISNIEKGIGYVWDTPERILGSFRQLKYKTQVSWLADNWQKKHGTDLQAYLSDKLDTDKQREVYLEILSITKNLPTGYIKE
jgi:hypothetical protein